MLLAEFNEQDQKVSKKLKEKSKVVMRLEAKVTELKKNEALAQRRILEEFRSSKYYQGEVNNATSKYFGEEFDFCKRQLAHHHPHLNIDLDNMDMDYEMLEKEEAVEEKEGGKEKGEE